MTIQSIAVLSIAALLSLTPLSATAATAKYPISLAYAQQSPWRAQVTALGEVRTLSHVTLHASMQGQLIGPFHFQGAHVTKGQLLARIIPPTLKAQIAAIRSQLKLEKSILTHTQTLYSEKLNTISDVQKAVSNISMTQDKLSGLLDESHQNRLRAPIRGTVHYLLPPGETISAGTPVVKIEGKATMWVRTYIPPHIARQLHIHEKVSLRGRTDHLVQGTLSTIGSEARNDGLVEILISLPKQNRYYPGEWLHITLPGNTGKAWHLPRRALVMRGSHSEIFTLKGGHAHQLLVTPVHIGRNFVWVKGPLHAKEPIIVSGADMLNNGTPVKLERKAG